MSVLAKSVLIVDDGPLICRTLGEILTRECDLDICCEPDPAGSH